MVKGTVRRCVRPISYLGGKRRVEMDVCLYCSKYLHSGAVFRVELICTLRGEPQARQDEGYHPQFAAGQQWPV